MKTIVVVDDEFDLTSTLRAILEARGYRVVTCGDGREARECLAQQRPDLLLLDVMMPLGNGYDVLSWLRSDAELADTAVVLMNSVDPPKDRPVTWQGFLRKPLALEPLFAAVEQLIGPASGKIA